MLNSEFVLASKHNSNENSLFSYDKYKKEMVIYKPFVILVILTKIIGYLCKNRKIYITLKTK